MYRRNASIQKEHQQSILTIDSISSVNIELKDSIRKIRNTLFTDTVTNTQVNEK